MNLRQIKDSKEVKKITQIYKLLPLIDERNFFFKLASKIAPYILDRRKDKGESVSTITFEINGNKVELKYPKLSLTINGVKIPAKGTGVKWLSDLVHSIFAMESGGELHINRPDGFTRKKERLQFKQAEGTMFPTIVNSVAYATGELDLSVKGTSANKLFLTESQYAHAKDKDKFEKKSNDKQVYYVRKGAKVVDLTNHAKKASRVIYALKNYSKPNQMELLKRLGIQEIVESPDFTDPNYVIVIGEEVFLCEAHENRPPNIKEIKVNRPEIKAPEVSTDERIQVENEYNRFKEWCKDNSKPVNAKSYEEFANKVDKGEIKI